MSATRRLGTAARWGLDTVLLTQGLISLGTAVLVGLYVFYRWDFAQAMLEDFDWVRPWVLWALAYPATFAAVLLLRQERRAPRLLSWRSLFYLGSSVAAGWHAMGFFVTPMHDVALWVGAHGRFGCRELGAGYWLTDRTIPWLLWALVPALYLLHAALSTILRARKEPPEDGA